MYDPKEIFTDDQIKQIRMFAISITNNMIPLQYKDHYWLSTGQLWDIDTYQAEVCRCLTMKEDDFLEYIALKMNDDNIFGNLKLFSKICYEYKIATYLKLKKICSFGDTVIVCEAGRGVDVMLATLVKPWQRILAYDQDKAVLYEMKKYFKAELGLPFEPQQINTLNYNFSGINEKTIVVATCHNIGEDKKKEILSNSNLLGILDGEILAK